MKKEPDDLDSFDSKINNSLQDVIRVMGESLVAWRQTPEESQTERQKLLERFIIASRDGFHLMATRLLRGRKRKDELDQLITSGQLDESDAAHDFAQLCVMSLIKSSSDATPKAPFIPDKIDEQLEKATTEGLPATGQGSPMSEYLYVVLFNSVARRISDVTKKAKKLRVGSENLIPQVDLKNLTVGDRRWGSEIAGTKAKVSLQQNVEFVRKIQDEYLDSQTYKGRPLREFLGNWTPLDEWIGYCATEDRPKGKDGIKEETLRQHINNVRTLINLAKAKVRKLTDEPIYPSLYDKETE